MYLSGDGARARITPAYAGKRAAENAMLLDDTGSPPPMRGKGQSRTFGGCCGRITPAYAGKSSIFLSASFDTGDHPRLCGEKVKKCCCAIAEAGSPPPMRGKAFVDRCVSDAERITPAYAGKSRYVKSMRYVVLDHPRLCGEKCVATAVVVLFTRITPAYAGKSAYGCRPMLFPQDHPRLCGEKWIHIQRHEHGNGSPPPMRGKGGCRVGCKRIRRITPAYAGKSPRLHTFSSTAQDHPRLCGEKAGCLVSLIVYRGSPPPMRGKVSPTYPHPSG